MKSNISELLYSDPGLTVTALARRASISRTIASELVNSEDIPGKTRFDVLQKVATALGVPVVRLFRLDDVKFQDAKMVPAIEQAHIPLTPRQRAYPPLKDVSFLTVSLGFVSLVVNDSEDGEIINFSYQLSSLGTFRLELISFADEEVLFRKDFSNHLGIDASKFANNKGQLAFRSNEFYENALQYISSLKTVKDLSKEYDDILVGNAKSVQLLMSRTIEAHSYGADVSSEIVQNENCYMMDDFFNNRFGNVK